MRFLLTLLLLIPFGLNAATVFTEFYCDSTVGTNINSGSTTNATATYTSVNGNFNGSTTFTPTDGSTPASTVSAGDWAAIYIDGATNLVQSGSGGYIVKITNVAGGVNGAITVSTTAFAGTAPSSSATGRSIKVGGAWNGPYGSIGFPFGFLATTATNDANVFPRCNLKSTAQYNITAAMTHANNGPIFFQGMTTTAGDGGKATIDGGASGTSYVLLTLSGANNSLTDLIFANNGNSGTAGSLVNVSGIENVLARVVTHDSWRHGINLSSTRGFAVECEAYNCGKDTAATTAGIALASDGSIALRCISHDNNSGANAHGFIIGTSWGYIVGCISDSNGGRGILANSTQGALVYGTDLYGNGDDGIDLTGASPINVYIENCNFIKNTGNGITSSGSSLRNGFMVNCRFGQGTQTNSVGNIAANLGGINEIGSALYTADQTPWTDPANGDFRINLTAAKAAGRGLFTQTAGSYTGTIAYPDIGAAQSPSTNAAAASGGGSYTFAQ